MALLTSPIINTSGSSPKGISIIRDLIVPNISYFPNNFNIAQNLPLSNNMSFKWIYALYDFVDNRSCSGELISTVKTNMQLKHSIYSLIGDRILYVIEPIIISGDVAIKITNNDINDVSANLTRFLL